MESVKIIKLFLLECSMHSRASSMADWKMQSHDDLTM